MVMLFPKNYLSLHIRGLFPPNLNYYKIYGEDWGFEFNMLVINDQ